MEWYIGSSDWTASTDEVTRTKSRAVENLEWIPVPRKCKARFAGLLQVERKRNAGLNETNEHAVTQQQVAPHVAEGGELSRAL